MLCFDDREFLEIGDVGAGDAEAGDGLAEHIGAAGGQAQDSLTVQLGFQCFCREGIVQDLNIAGARDLDKRRAGSGGRREVERDGCAGRRRLGGLAGQEAGGSDAGGGQGGPAQKSVSLGDGSSLSLTHG